MLRGLLIDLRDGHAVPGVETIRQQSGGRIAADTLSFRDGIWQMDSVSCHNSAFLGLGSCGCFSHDPYWTETISRSEALAFLRRVIAAEQADRQNRDAEIAWLDQAIAKLAERQEG